MVVQLETVKVKIRQPLSKVSYAIENDEMSNFIDQYRDVILDELNVKSIERLTNAGDLVNYKIKPNLPVLGRKYQSGLKDIIGFLNTQDNDDYLMNMNLRAKSVLRKTIINST